MPCRATASIPIQVAEWQSRSGLYHRKQAKVLPEASDCKNIHWLKLERSVGDDGLA
jgi:hypothetical protein